MPKLLQTRPRRPMQRAARGPAIIVTIAIMSGIHFPTSNVQAQTPCQVAKLLASDGKAKDHFGWALDATGDVLAVGANYTGDLVTGGGSAYLFRRQASGWSEVSKVLPSKYSVGA